jgi:ribosomal protein S18 acetylase RimI-like enzyme
VSVHFQSSAEPDDRTTTGVVVERLAATQIDELEPLWASLVRHHSALNGAVPFREPDDSWPRLRDLYLEILAEQDGFCLVARREARPVAYAIVKIEGPEQVWHTGDKLAELETLTVADDERGGGVGTLMMEEVERELALREVDDLLVGVEAPNAGAQRFYERRGYSHAFTWLYGKPLTWRNEQEGLAGDGI